jgi:hypothetical protein
LHFEALTSMSSKQSIKSLLLEKLFHYNNEQKKAVCKLMDAKGNECKTSISFTLSGDCKGKLSSHGKPLKETSVRILNTFAHYN